MKLEPYRVLFPIGLAYGLYGALLWLLHAIGQVSYPGPLHRALMIQGFELSFVLGFMLTAAPGFLHAQRCHPLELTAAAALAIGFGLLAIARQTALAQACFVLAVLLAAVAAGRRLPHASQPPAVELMFAGLGLVLGLAGGVVTLADAAGWRYEPLPGFGLRMVSLGLVLSMVLGVGGLLVPTFTGVRQPLVIPHVGGPHERAGRRVLYGLLCGLLFIAFMLESRGHRAFGAWLRALAATPILLAVWKLPRPPARRDVFSLTLRTAGWCVLAGLWLAALLPRYTLAAYHVLFIGGFGLLTLGIATRVVVAHGGHGMELERKVLNPWAAGAVGLSVLARITAEFVSGHYNAMLGLSGVLWSAGWAIWAWRAMPLVIAGRRGAIAKPPPVASR